MGSSFESIFLRYFWGIEFLSESCDIPFLFFYTLRYVDLLIDKQELVGNKILKVNSLCGSDTMDVSVERQFPTSRKKYQISSKSHLFQELKNTSIFR
jgi:hypothetical protein